MFGQSFGDGAADAARGAGDDREAPGQVEQTGQDFLPLGATPLDDGIVRRCDARGDRFDALKIRDVSIVKTQETRKRMSCDSRWPSHRRFAGYGGWLM